VKREATWFLQMAYKAFYRSSGRVLCSHAARRGRFSLLDRRTWALNSLPRTIAFFAAARVGWIQADGRALRAAERMLAPPPNRSWESGFWRGKRSSRFPTLPSTSLPGWPWASSSSPAVLTVSKLACACSAAAVGSQRLYPRLIVLILFMGGVQLLCFSNHRAYLKCTSTTRSSGGRLML